jgi:hypothetical protein
MMHLQADEEGAIEARCEYVLCKTGEVEVWYIHMKKSLSEEFECPLKEAEADL